MSHATLTFDPDANAVYLSLEIDDPDVAETIEVSSNVYIDVNSAGEVIGIEVLNASRSVRERFGSNSG